MSGATLRISALGVPRFYDSGLDVGEGWTDIAKDATEKRAALIEYVGRFVRVHPEDVKNLAALGLELVDGKLIEAAKTKKNGAKSADKE